jgi:hypothetical protein
MTAAATGRSCGSCTLCCKVYDVPVMEKPRGVWCKACTPGKGCGIWDSRPEFCRSFHCQWIHDASLGPEWKPDVARFVMNIQHGKMLAVAVDPGHRHAWRREPYYSAFKGMVPKLFSQGLMLVVSDGVNKVLVTPDADIVVSKHNETVDCELKIEGDGPLRRWVAVTGDERRVA